MFAQGLYYIFMSERGEAIRRKLKDVVQNDSVMDIKEVF